MANHTTEADQCSLKFEKMQRVIKENAGEIKEAHYLLLCCCFTT